MLKIQNLKKSFKGNIVINNLNLHLKQGELIHIKGSNGSGKSTLLKVISGLLEADEGSISKEPGLKIGALIENPSFIENETAVSNLKFLYNLTGRYDEEHVKTLFEQFNLDYNSTIKISKYSIGMRQKVGIIQAIMENQDLILLDEPTRGLDEDSICEFNKIINNYITTGKSILICAHDGVDGIHFNKVYRLIHGQLELV